MKCGDNYFKHLNYYAPLYDELGCLCSMVNGGGRNMFNGDTKYLR